MEFLWLPRSPRLEFLWAAPPFSAATERSRHVQFFFTFRRKPSAGRRRAGGTQRGLRDRRHPRGAFGLGVGRGNGAAAFRQVLRKKCNCRDSDQAAGTRSGRRSTSGNVCARRRPPTGASAHRPGFHMDSPCLACLATLETLRPFASQPCVHHDGERFDARLDFPGHRLRLLCRRDRLFPRLRPAVRSAPC